MANLLTIPSREALDVDEDESGEIVIRQTDAHGNESTIQLCLADAHALACALNEWLAERQ
jgi:hypothetical protein